MPLCGNAYKVSVTDSPFCVIWYDKHSADWLAALASPYPAAPDFPRKRGQNKTPRNTLFINGSTVCAGYSATVEVLHRTSKWGEVRRLACPLRRFPFAAPPNCGGKVVAPATKGGMHFLARRAVVWFSCRRRRHFKLPSEPARSVGRTHRSVRSTRTIEPGRRKAPEPSSPKGTCP